MKSIRNFLTLLVCLLGSVLVYSQPNLLQKYNVGTGNGYGAMQFLYPFEGGVIQRNSSGNAKVSFCIQVNYGLQNTSNYTYKLILDRLSPISGNSTGVITIIPGNLTVSNIVGETGTIKKDLTIAEGWYTASVQVTDIVNSISWTGVHIKFGVGDTFLIAGQSNARGFPQVWDTGLISHDNTPGLVLPDAVRVLTGFKPKVTGEVDRTNLSIYANEKKRYVLNNGMPFFHSMEKLTLNEDMGFDGPNGIDWFERPIFPNGMASWCWAPLGSKLVSNGTDVPVQFFNFAIDNSSMGHWQKNPINPDPPGPLGTALENHYKTLSDFIGFQGNVMGFRSVLWHQGERDVTDATSSADYKTRLESLINSIQNDFDPWQNTPTPGRIWEPLNWLVSKVAYSTDGGNPLTIITNDPTNIKGAQVSANPATNGSKKYLGIDSDVYGVGSRGSGNKIHFTGSTHNQVAQLWKNANLLQGNAKIPQAFLFPITSSFNSGSNTYTLTPPGGYSSYYWVKNENSISDPSTQIKTGAGQLTVSKDESPDRVVYTCFIKNPAGTNYLMCQPFVVPNEADRTGVLAVQSINSFNSGGGVKTFDVTSSNVTWNASTSGSWLSLSTTVGGPGVTSINLMAASNSGSLRNATVTVSGTTTNGQSVSKTINVSQGGNSSDIALTTLTPASSYIGAGTINYNGLNVSGNTMKVNGQTYTQGIGTHSQSGIVYNLPSGYTHFNGLVGRDDGSDNCGCGSTQMNFQIKLNGNVVWSSMSHGENSNAESFSVPLNGATQLELFTDYQDGSYFGDWGDWINPVLSGSGGGPTGSPAPPHTISANPATVAPNATSQLSATCAQGVVTWSNNATGSPISVNPSVTTTYNVNCVDGSAYSTSEAVTVNVTGGGGSCSAVTDMLGMGIWNVTGDSLVSRYLNGSYWLVQKVNVNGSQYDEFVVRASQMLTRGDVTLTNSSYSGLVNCYSWQYSNYGGLEVPNATSSPAFPVPSGFHGYTSSDGTEYYSTYVSPSNACSVLSNHLYMGTWNATGDQLISRYFHSDYWLVQKVNVNGGQYDEFVVRGSAMLTRTDVSLDSSSYYNLYDCYGWVYSNYGNLAGPSVSTFPTPSGYYRFVSNGTTYFSNYANGYNEGARMGTLEEREASEELTPFLSFTPNPNTGKFEVILFLNEASEVQVSLTNAVGRQVLNKELNGIKGYNQMEIELKNKTPGVYIIKAVSDGKQDSKKVVIN